MSARTPRRMLAIVAGVMSATLLLAGCSGSEDSTEEATAADGPHGTLTIGQSSAIQLDPGYANPPLQVFPGYDTLIHQEQDGSYSPGLALSWGFTDDTHTAFQLKLRTDATFTDGTPLTAQAVVDWYVQMVASNPSVASGSPYEVGDDPANPDYTLAFEAIDDETVQFNYSEAVPLALPQDALSQNRSGTVAGAEGTADSGIFTSQSDGIGPYVYDASQSDDTQSTWVPNEDYYNQDAIKYEKVVIRSIADPTALQTALLSGEIDFAYNASTSDYESNVEAGYNVITHGSTALSMQFMNQESGPLADINVRKALAKAVDRESVLEALYPEDLVTVQSSWMSEATVGYTGEDPYPYDLEGAKEELAAAGYPDGFTIDAVVYEVTDPGLVLAQSFVSELAKVGVTVNLTPITGDYTALITATGSKDYDAIIGATPVAGDAYTVYTGFIAGPSNNPWGLEPESISEAMAAAAVAPDDEAESTQQDITRALDGEAWGIVLGMRHDVSYYNDTVCNVPDSATATPYPFDPTGELAYFSCS